MIRKRSRNEMRLIRHLRLRQKLSGTAEAPRLAVFRSLKHIYAQVIDDNKGCTLCSLSTLSKDFKSATGKTKKTEISYEVGLKLGEKALANGITQVAFDRAGYKYHGRVKALAEGARKAGLMF